MQTGRASVCRLDQPTAAHTMSNCGCMQEDTFIPTCTTKETLAFYAGVTLGAGWTRSSKRERVAQVLEAVGLGHTADTLVSVGFCSGCWWQRLGLACVHNGVAGENIYSHLHPPAPTVPAYINADLSSSHLELALCCRRMCPVGWRHASWRPDAARPFGRRAQASEHSCRHPRRSISHLPGRTNVRCVKCACVVFAPGKVPLALQTSRMNTELLPTVQRSQHAC